MRQDPSKPFGAVYPLSRENLVAAQRVLAQKHTSELSSNKYWTEILCGTQLACVAEKQPGNGAAYQREWCDTVKAVTLKDLELMLTVLDLKEANMHTCIALSGNAQASDAPPPDLHGHTMPSLMRR